MIKSLIVAYDSNRAIGKNNGIPWYLPRDLQRFSKLTTGHTVVMGYKTFLSLPKSLSLPYRLNIILSSKKRKLPENAIQAYSIEEALEIAKVMNPTKEVFFIGGEGVYRQVLDIVDYMYLTEIKHTYEGDTYFPEVNLDNFEEIKKFRHTTKEGIKYNFIDYKRK